MDISIPTKVMNLYHEDGLRGFVFLSASYDDRSSEEGVTADKTAGIMRKRNYIKTDRILRLSLARKLFIGVIILAAMYFVSSLVLGEMGVVKYYRMKKQYSALHDEIAQMKTDNTKLVKSVNALKTDPAYLERIARDKLGLARPGEIVYYYKEP